MFFLLLQNLFIITQKNVNLPEYFINVSAKLTTKIIIAIIYQNILPYLSKGRNNNRTNL